MPMPRKEDPKKNCEYCEKSLQRKVFNGGRLEDRGIFLQRKYCDRLCMGLGMTHVNPSRWAIAKRIQKYKKDYCEKCGAKVQDIGPHQIHIHHRDQNWMNNNQANLETLCGSCHLKWHWQNGKSVRPSPPCKICGKSSDHSRNRMCQKHYQRWKKYGDPLLRKYGPHLRKVLPDV